MRNANHEDIVAAAKKACCHDFIMALPDGYDTIIGENVTLGSNVFITSSVEPNMTVTILGEKKHKEE